MSAEQNKALMRRLFALSDEHRGQLPAELFAPNYRFHAPGSQAPLDYQGHVQMARMFYAAFPDLRHEIEDQVAEGDTVVTRVSIRGTHQGELMGLPTTGKSVTVTATSLDRIVDGRIVEEWVNNDTLGLLQQLGAFPAPARAGATA